jgi:hypothetical protein
VLAGVGQVVLEEMALQEVQVVAGLWVELLGKVQQVVLQHRVKALPEVMDTEEVLQLIKAAVAAVQVR